jgi:hypothetical protein
MVWRRIAVSSSCTLRELHGTIQVAMGWEGIHLFRFCLRTARYGSWEVSASSPDVKLAELQLRKGARLLYEYDLNVPREHEVRLEDRPEPETGKKYPSCLGGGGHLCLAKMPSAFSFIAVPRQNSIRPRNRKS